MTREPEKFHMARVDVEAASCTAAKSRYSITSSARMEAGDKVISPLPVALVEGRRRAHWYRPGTTDSLNVRQPKVLHYVNRLVAQSKMRGQLVDRFYPRHFDLRQGRCRRFGRLDRRRLLRMCGKRPCRRRTAEKRDELAPFH